MAFSTNFYLDNAISAKEISQARTAGNKPRLKEIDLIISQKALQIFFYFRIDGKTIKVFTERKSRQIEWDFEKQRVNPRYFKEGAVVLNNYLYNIEKGAVKIYETNLEKAIVTTKDHFKELVDNLNGRDRRKAPQKITSLTQVFDEFKKDREFKVTSKTVSNFETTFKKLRDFSKKSYYELTFENINSKFESKFKDYLYTELNAANNTVSKHIKNIKVLMNFCTEEREYNSKLNVAYKKFVRRHNESEVYALTLDELMKLYNFNFDSEKLQQVRDVFCFMCFTGLRFSDVEKLKREEIKTDRIELVVQKTKTRNIIPLNDFSKEILSRYSALEKPLPIISNQKTNDYLHEIGRLIELNEPVAKSTYRGANVTTEYLPKYDVLTTHMGRKTFITNSLILGMNERVVREFSGHKKDSTFKRYVAFADQYKQDSMNDAWNKQTVETAIIN